jgi:hypothetical protein
MTQSDSIFINPSVIHPKSYIIWDHSEYHRRRVGKSIFCGVIKLMRGILEWKLGTGIERCSSTTALDRLKRHGRLDVDVQHVLRCSYTSEIYLPIVACEE